MKVDEVVTVEVTHPNTSRLVDFAAFVGPGAANEAKEWAKKEHGEDIYEVDVKKNGLTIAVGGLDPEPSESLKEEGVEILWGDDLETGGKE